MSGEQEREREKSYAGALSRKRIREILEAREEPIELFIEEQTQFTNSSIDQREFPRSHLNDNVVKRTLSEKRFSWKVLQKPNQDNEGLNEKFLSILNRL